MNSFDNMDIEDMLNNPLKNIDVSGKSRPLAQDTGRADEIASRHKQTFAPRRATTEADVQRMEKNQPSSDRLLSLEKGIYSADQRVDTLKRIIEEQNTRIQKIEEELDMLRGVLTGGTVQIPSSNQESPETTDAVE